MAPPSGDNSESHSEVGEVLDMDDSKFNFGDQDSGAFMNDQSFNARMSTGSLGSGALANNNQKKPKELAHQETKAVNTLRAVTLMVILGAAIAVAIFMYVYMHGVEQDALDDNFYDLSHRLVEGFHANAKVRVQTLDLFASAITSTVLATNQEWPFITIPNFEAKGTATRAIVSSDYVGFYPVVTRETRKDWEAYTVENTAFLNESFAYQQAFKAHYGYDIGARAPVWRRRGRRDLETTLTFDHLFEPLEEDEEGDNEEPLGIDEDEIMQEDQPAFRESVFDGPDNITTELYRYGTEEEGVLFVVDESDGPYFPMFQVSPTREYSYIDVNYNFNDPFYAPAFTEGLLLSHATGTAIFAGVWNVDDEGYIDENDDYDFREVPALSLFYPVFDKVDEFEDRKVTGMIDLDIEFGPLATSVLPANSNELVLVMENPCDQVFSYSVTGQRATYLGAEDLHDSKFEKYKTTALLTDFYDPEDQSGATYNGVPVDKSFCPWSITVYGTQELEDAFLTSGPVIYTFVVLGIFLFTAIVFVVYDRLVEARQKTVMTTAVNSEKIVDQLFPEEFKAQLYENNQQKKSKGISDTKRVDAFIERSREFMVESNNQSNANSTAMAQLYPKCSVYFADIAGFTSWSSSRSPADVFALLETLYGAFDTIAKKHKVFKIETIGDCYVAVTGLPLPRDDHALLMTRFARDCLLKATKLFRTLESRLGPETSDLNIRIGIHSGAVTAGVLRGEKARFQLFGDTVNTSARMESNGLPGQIHVSQATNDLLVAAGKGSWMQAREEKIIAKGKGAMQTYWCRPPGVVGCLAKSNTARSVSSGGSSDDMDDEGGTGIIELSIAGMEGPASLKGNWVEENRGQLNWLSDLFKTELKKLLGRRGSAVSNGVDFSGENGQMRSEIVWGKGLVESLLLPSGVSNGQEVQLPSDVDQQVVEFVSMLAFSFQDMPYHNFRHSCLVILCMQQMLDQTEETMGPDFVLSPMTKFACLFSALIRNIRPRVQNQSWKESKSTEIAFKILMDRKFDALQRALFSPPSPKSDFSHFQNLVSNLLLATFSSTDAILAKGCNERWETAFKEGTNPRQQIVPVLEQIILIAQHAHSIQSWENYTTWSLKLLEEAQQQYCEGKIQVDPTTTWYQKALGYFDSFLIPLAKKIDQGGILGSMGSGFAMHAVENRQIWESTGKDIVAKADKRESALH